MKADKHIKEILKDTGSTYFFLLKIMIPISIIVKILEEIGAIELIGENLVLVTYSLPESDSYAAQSGAGYYFRGGESGVYSYNLQDIHLNAPGEVGIKASLYTYKFLRMGPQNLIAEDTYTLTFQ